MGTQRWTVSKGEGLPVKETKMCSPPLHLWGEGVQGTQPNSVTHSCTPIKASFSNSKSLESTPPMVEETHLAIPTRVCVCVRATWLCCDGMCLCC